MTLPIEACNTAAAVIARLAAHDARQPGGADVRITAHTVAKIRADIVDAFVANASPVALAAYTGTHPPEQLGVDLYLSLTGRGDGFWGRTEIGDARASLALAARAVPSRFRVRDGELAL